MNVYASICEKLQTSINDVNFEIRFLRRELKRYRADIEDVSESLRVKLEHRRALREMLKHARKLASLDIAIGNASFLQ